MPVAYDSQNIFARILRGEMHCYKVYEDEAALAFMDIMPRSDGHVLVIPKKPARNLLDIEPGDLGELMARVQKVAQGVKKAMGAEGITLQQFNESAGGQVVFHLHFHILPRWAGVSLRPHTGQLAEAEALKEHQKKIAAILA